LYLTNATGLLPSGPVASPSPLYFFSNGTSIINRSEIVSEFSVKIILNHPFGPFLSFLSYISNAIISPYSHSQTAFIDLTTGDLIGTGPFMFNYYTSSIEARFDRYDDYWRGPSDIEELIFAIISNYDARMNSLLAQDVDIVNGIGTGYLNPFIADPDITLYDAGPDLIYRYYGFNNDNVNVTWREAISYTINYSYIVEDYRGGGASRGYPAVPEGMPGHNSSVQANLPFLNRTYARILMQSMGFGTTFDIYNDAEWLSQATSSPFRDFNLLGNSGSQMNLDLLDIFTDNVEYIGCSTTETDLGYYDYFYALRTYPNSYDVHYIGWAPDYPDAYIMLYYIFYSSSTENTAQVDIPLVDSLLDSSVSETDEPTRLDYFKQIQYILFEQEFVHAPLYADRAYFAHTSILNGLQYNPFKYYYFYNCSFPYLGPGPFTLDSDADDPDLDGTFLLNWTDSENVMYYTVYFDTEFISEINGSQSMLASGITETNYSINDYPTDIYYFIIEAYNPDGTMLSNCIQVNVTNTGPPRISSIYDGLYLNFTFSMMGSDYGTLRIDYTYLSGNTFLVNETLSAMGPYGAYHVNNQTRFITDIGYGHLFFGNRPVYWIFANQQLGDLVNIAVDGVGDHIFNITGQTGVVLPELSSYTAWTLEDLSEAMTLALYDKETGILLNATFYYSSGETYYYSLTLIDTNYGIMGEPPGDLVLGSTAESPELDGDFNLVWTASDRADSYSVYQSSSFITAIDGSVTLLAGDLTTLTYAIENYPTGTYYFIVVATNDFGETLSNCIQIVVGLGGFPEGIPGYEPFMILGIIAVSTLLIMKKIRKKN
jgi:ABC-type transport system substrate-binding protein